jgi:transcriptional regulator with XRE-family HTH domain
MLISELQERLRVVLCERIAGGEITGTELAARAGFQQAHISNFLNQRRGLSVEALDRIMRAMHLEVRDLVPRAAAGAVESGMESVPVVAPEALLHANFASGEIVEQMKFKKNLLRRLRAAMAGPRQSWQRFVLVKADRDAQLAMRPRLQAGALLLVDRHYNSLERYRANEANIYVLKRRAEWRVRYVEVRERQLMLRPESAGCALGFWTLGRGESAGDFVVGRVAHAAGEV